jgi:transposase
VARGTTEDGCGRCEGDPGPLGRRGDGQPDRPEVGVQPADGAEVRGVLYQRLHDDQGLQASWATFYRYLQQHWPERLRGAPRPTVRLDDPPPGSEAQVDFFYVGLWDDPEAGRRRRLYAFLMTLSHSRHQFLYPVLAEDGQAWQEGHAAAFTFFGGVPQRVVPDNLTPGIVKADRYDPRLNRAYGELARHYGCLIDPARVYRPTDKPRVERTVSYARESFFRGRTGDDLIGLRAAARRWCLEVAGQRVHGTTGERPLVAFQEREQVALLPLPARPWQPIIWTSATVHPDCHLQAKGARYSVPYRYVGQRLEVRLSPVLVEIYAGPTLVASHVRRHGGGPPSWSTIRRRARRSCGRRPRPACGGPRRSAPRPRRSSARCWPITRSITSARSRRSSGSKSASGPSG